LHRLSDEYRTLAESTTGPSGLFFMAKNIPRTGVRIAGVTSIVYFRMWK
jgi:hypothetical protein